MIGGRANKKIIRDIGAMASGGIPFLVIVDFEMAKPLIFPLSSLPGDILFQTPGHPGSGAAPKDHKSFRFEKFPVTFPLYRQAFDLVTEQARLGRTYLTNLTFPTGIRTDLELKDIYRMSHARYKLLFKDEFVVFSPETFVQIRDGKIFSFPMKGTINADIPDASRILLEDEKEMAEHVTIVDLIRNDLSMYASQVRVDKFRYIDRLQTSEKNLLQVSSVISGQLPSGYETHLGDILFSMLPAGSVSGAPKPETLRIIRESEGAPRGYYTGIMGYFDGKDFDSCVLIRYIEKLEGKMQYRSGGGITFMSDVDKEYQELIDKVYVPLA